MEVARAGMVDPSDPVLPEADGVIIDLIVEHPGGSIGEITARAGFAQSYVSASVTRMRESGWVHTSSDPGDRRRTLVWPVEAMRVAIVGREERDAAPVLAAALGHNGTDGNVDPVQLADVLAVLEELHQRLTERAVGLVKTGPRRRSDRPMTLPPPPHRQRGAGQ